MPNDKRAKPVQTSHRDVGKREQSTIRNRDRGTIEPADWASVSPELLVRIVCAVTRRGCAIQFGYTRDGGNYSIRIVGDGEPYNEYPSSPSAISEKLVDICFDFEAGVTDIRES